MTEISDELNLLVERVIGAAIEVHRTLGPGYLERVYEEALAVEFEIRGIPFQRQHPVAVMYKGRCCGEGSLDFLVGSELIIELKATEKFVEIHRGQVLSYLKATGLKLGLLINFHFPVLKDGIKRIIRSTDAETLA